MQLPWALGKSICAFRRLMVQYPYVPRRQRMKFSVPLAAAAAGLAALSLAAIYHSHSSRPSGSIIAAGSATAGPLPVSPKPRRVLQPPLPAAQLVSIQADETGRIPILMYHAFGAPARHGTRYDKEGLNIAPETFRKHLEMMYAAHWYPVDMRDVLTAHLNVPAGKTPVVLTFDDARGTQFHYLKDGTIDPNCAVGMLQNFHSRHPDWPLRGTFYVLPKSAWNPVPFWQPGKETQKLRYLVANGFEVANHSTTHRPMTHLSGTELCWEMAECQRYVQDRVPGLAMDTMALPGGAAPKNHALWNCLLRGRLGQIAYRNRCILMAWGGPSRSWADKKFDPDRVTRIGTGPGWVERALQRLTAAKKTHGFLRPYVSDGNPDTVAVPRVQAKMVDLHRLNGARLVTYDDGSGSKPKLAPKPGVKTLVAGKPADRKA